MRTFNHEQLEIISEIANYAKLKGMQINCKSDLDKAFQGYLKSNLTHNYFTNEDFKNNLILNIKNQISK